LAAGESEIAFAGYCNERAQPSTHCGMPVAVTQRDQRKLVGYLVVLAIDGPVAHVIGKDRVTSRHVDWLIGTSASLSPAQR